MAFGTQGILGAFEPVANEVRNDITALSIPMFYNEYPLITRLSRVPVGSVTFETINYNLRKRGYFLKTDLTGESTASTTTVSVALTSGGSNDSTPFMVGDVLELASGERFEVTAVPNGTQLTVAREKDGTSFGTASLNAVNSAVTLISNSRTGKEVDQAGFRPARSKTSQQCQVWQYPVQVGGSAMSTTSAVLPPGIANFFEGERLDKLRDMYRDMEYSTLYGGGEAPLSDDSRPKQKGLRSLIVTNRVTNPENKTDYTPADLIRDTIQRCRDNGGNPDVFLFSTSFLTALHIWGIQYAHVPMGNTIFGVPITAFQIPMLAQNVQFIEAPMLKPNSVVCLTSQEVRWRTKRNEFWNLRGNRGDAVEGEWIAEGAVELHNESHHAWVENITQFAAP